MQDVVQIRRPSPAPLIAGVVLLLVLLLFLWQSWLATRDEQVLQLRTVAELTERATDRYFLQMQGALGELAEDLVAADGLRDGAAAQRLLAAFEARHSELLAANLLALDGRFLATSRAHNPAGLASTTGLRDFAEIVATLRPERPMELARPLVGPLLKRWILPLRYTVRDGSGNAVGFIIAAAPVEMLQSFWSQAPVMAHAAVALVRDDAYLISRYPTPQGNDAASVYGRPRAGAVLQHLRANGFPAQGVVEGTSLVDGEARCSVFKRLEHFPVTLVASTSMRTLYTAWWHRVRVPLLFAVLAAVGSLLGLRHLRRREHQWSSERLHAELELRRSQSLLDRTGQVARVGGWSLDLVQGRLEWSPQARHLHEADADFEPTAESTALFFPPPGRAQLAAAFEAGVREGTPWDLELPFVSARGREMWVRAQGEAEFADGRPVRLVGTLQDITEYRQRRAELAQEQLLRSQAEQQAADLARLLRERGEMLDVLAHEVRQPLNNASAALQGAASTLDGASGSAAPRSLQRAQDVLTDVLAHIDNTLAVAALLAQPAGLRRMDTDIDMLVRLAIGDMPAGQQGRIAIERLTTTRTAAMDTGLMRLALRNLLSNALRHGGSDGRVTVRIADSDEPLALVIEVADSGPGVDAALLPRLFERGVRGSGSADGAGHGLGLGLYIVRRVMDLHGGSVQALNQPGHGLTMRLVIDQSELP